MEDVSEILINARKSKGLDLDQVARDTHISRDYLEGLESDDYSNFPAEPYVVGFLRNYCEYLGLNPEDVIQTYKQVQMQETVVPQEILLPKKVFPTKIVLLAIVALLALGLVGFGAYSLIKYISNRPAETVTQQSQTSKPDTNAVKITSERQPTVYNITDEKFEERLFIGDSFTITVEEKKYEFVVKNVSPDLELETPHGLQIVKLGENIALDLDEDLDVDIEIGVADLDKANPNNGALLMIGIGKAVVANIPKVDTGATTDTVNTPKNYVTLFEGGSAYPVTLNVSFRGYCFFRYEIDRGNRVERYYQKNESFTIQANNNFRIWAANGNTVKLQLVAGGKTVDLDVTRPGEVIVQDLKWIKDSESGRYKFVVVDVD